MTRVLPCSDISSSRQSRTDFTVELATPSVVALRVGESSPKAKTKLHQAQLFSFIFGEGWQLIVVLLRQRDVVLEPNGLCLLECLAVLVELPELPRVVSAAGQVGLVVV